MIDSDKSLSGNEQHIIDEEFLGDPSTFPPGTSTAPIESNFEGYKGYVDIRLGDEKRPTYRCGGTLIDYRWVLTMALCAVKDFNTGDLFDIDKIYLYMHDAQVFDRVSLLYVPLEDKRQIWANKGKQIYMLLKTAYSSFSESDNIRIINLVPSIPTRYAKIQTHVIGFGARSYRRTWSRMLFAKIDVVHFEKLYGYPTAVSTDRSTNCISDIGGPLFFNNFLLGVASALSSSRDGLFCNTTYRLVADQEFRSWMGKSIRVYSSNSTRSLIKAYFSLIFITVIVNNLVCY